MNAQRATCSHIIAAIVLLRSVLVLVLITLVCGSRSGDYFRHEEKKSQYCFLLWPLLRTFRGDTRTPSLAGYAIITTGKRKPLLYAACEMRREVFNTLAVVPIRYVSAIKLLPVDLSDNKISGTVVWDRCCLCRTGVILLRVCLILQSSAFVMILL